MQHTLIIILKTKRQYRPKIAIITTNNYTTYGENFVYNEKEEYSTQWRF